MRNRLTDKARKVIDLAQNAAHRAGVQEFGSDFILLGIAHYRDPCLAEEILRCCEVLLDGYIEEYGRRQPRILDATGKLSDEFIEAAWKEAGELNHNYIGTEHFLLAIMRFDSSASEYLRAAGGDHQKFQDTVIELIGMG